MICDNDRIVCAKQYKAINIQDNLSSSSNPIGLQLFSETKVNTTS
jgi:hypothetical protein